MFDQILAAALDAAMLPVFAVAVVAGLVRGFAGFGAGLLFVPFASALIDPASAVIMLWIADGLPTLPLVVKAIPKCRFRQVLPVAAGYALGAPAGVWLLKTADPVPLRWFMAILVTAMLALLISGRRYAGEPKPAYGVGVGAASGFLGGATQLSGPPVLAYWLGGPDISWRIRANVLVFFAIATVLSGLSLWGGGVFTAERVVRGAAMIPFYAVGIFVGARLFPLASDATFRRIAFALIALAALLSLPLLDGLLGRG